MTRTTRAALRSGAAASLAALLAAGCGISGGGGDAPGSQGVGDPCTSSDQCRGNLECVSSGTCQPTGDGAEGDYCQLTAECGEGLYCGPGRTCVPAGEGGDGGDCATTADCGAGLVCVVEGFGGRCRDAGEGDIGDLCALQTDCLAGLTCEVSSRGEWVCTDPRAGPGTGLPPAVPYWAGEDCPDEAAAPTAYFHVPRGDGSDRDFYGLPYPNDIRRGPAGIDLSGHASPETALPVDMIGRYLRASEQDLEGFGTNPVVFFRFSTRYSGSSLDGAIRMINVTPGSPEYGRTHGIAWMNTYGRVSAYICPNWLAVRRMHGEPLRPGETYAVFVDDRVEVEGGGSFARSPDLDALLAGEAPADPALTSAYEAYEPFRAWLAEAGEDPGSVLNAAVFTTQDPERVTGRLREAVRAGPRPALADLALCGEGVVSPCDDGTEARACGPEDPAFHEVHGRISLPVFQQGSPPYEEPEDGGGIEVDAEGVPVAARTEEVCFAMTIPRSAEMPAEGWPLLLYAHGTGGSFRNAVLFGIAAEAADGLVGEVPVAAATLAVDMPQHGERRGGSSRGSDVLFFNFANPRAARDNVAQGAADLHALVYFAEAFDLAAAGSPTSEAIAFDPSRVALLAHSQGATHASLAIPFEEGLVAVVLSGNGGDLTQSLLHKSEPIDIAGILPFALLDANEQGALTARDFHPALAIFQAYFERSDPVNFGRRLAREPLEEVPGRHVFMTYGLRDSYSPEPTMEAYARAARFTIVGGYLSEEWGMETADPPLAGNASVGGEPFTVGLRQYEPGDGDDGHFVSTLTDQGRADVLRFLLGALSGAVPAIGE